MNRSVRAIYCDDIRLETQGKLSLMGVYSDAMYLPQFPANVMKFCVVIDAVTPPEKPFKELKISARYNDTVIAELDITHEQILQQLEGAPAPLHQNAQAQLVFSPLILDKPGLLSIVFECDGETLQANPLHVFAAPDSQPI